MPIFINKTDELKKDQKIRPKSRRKSDVVKVSNTIAACNYLNRKKRIPASKKPKTSPRKLWLQKPSTRENCNTSSMSASEIPSISSNNDQISTPIIPPAIVICPDNSEPEPDVEFYPHGKKLKPKRRESLGSIALKARESSLVKERRKSHGDMSHIRAKWLLGFNLTMVRDFIIFIYIIPDFFKKLFSLNPTIWGLWNGHRYGRVKVLRNIQIYTYVFIDFLKESFNRNARV